MSAQPPVIATKLNIPTQRSDLVLRPRLKTLLEASAHCPLTLISAPPGFGKTMLTTQWVREQAEQRVAWLSLDEGDSQPAVFWRYVISALQNSQPGLAETALMMLITPNPPPIETILANLINDVASLKQPLLLVLDDYHLVQNAEIHKSLNFLLDHIPENLHLFILTREDPPLNLARRRARRAMVEIRATELRFDIDETASFLRSMELSLTPEQIDILERHTEGWIAGLQMAALSLRGQDPRVFFKSFTGDDRYIADYLIEEVVGRQTEAVRDFLLRTSILEKMNASICEVVLGDKRQGIGEASLNSYPLAPNNILDYLDRANLFLIPLDNRREWYRYHQLFAELLRQRLKDTFPAKEIAQLHRVASVWCEEHGDIYAAIRQARQIPDEGRVAALLKKYAVDFFKLGELPQLVELARALPPEMQEIYPDLNMAIAWASLATNQTADPWLEKIEKQYSKKASAAIHEPSLEPAVRAALLEVLIVLQQRPFENYTSQAHEELLAIQKQLETFPNEMVCLFNSVASLKPVI
jgi:LuxR family maltose regulon positive regulatory protein